MLYHSYKPELSADIWSSDNCSSNYESLKYMITIIDWCDFKGSGCK